MQDRSGGEANAVNSGKAACAARALRQRLRACDICPRRCGVDRLRGERGVCGTGARAVVASYGPHFGEEAPLVGHAGSGTVFFSGCPLRCAICQNYDISHRIDGEDADVDRLAGIFLSIARMGCHNLNLVTPTHVTPQIVEALERASAHGFSLPVVYNCGGYERLETLRELEGVVDIYMPDLKFLSATSAALFCDAPDYPAVAREALREMARQVGPLVLDSRQLAVRGLLVRHLVMPGDASTTRDVIDFLAEEIGRDTYLNLMDQYRPCGNAGDFPGISRRISRTEWQDARAYAISRGLTRLDGEC
ncbi:MAG: radical SAM protein [Verrucomicrobiota bacterium]